MNTGSALARFTITLSQAVTEPVQVEWFTSDGTAKAGVDYAANKGTVVFSPGQTSKTVDILVYGRAVGSEDRSFFVEMLPPTNAILGASIGECIITVDTSGSTPVTQVIVPTGPVGQVGKSAYQSYLDTTTDNPPMTEVEWVESLNGDPEEIAVEVAPLIDVGNTVLTAEDTESLGHPDSTTVKAVARRVAYASPAKIATVTLASGDNTIGQADMTGDVLDLNSECLYPRIMRGSTVISPKWSIQSDGKVLVKDAVAGDVLYMCQYDLVSTKKSNTNTREIWRRSLADAGLNLVDGSFEDGATINSKNDAIWHIAGSQCYVWDGSLPKTVIQNSTPVSTGGVAAGAWVSSKGKTLRPEYNVTANFIGSNSYSDFPGVGGSVTAGSDYLYNNVLYTLVGDSGDVASISGNVITTSGGTAYLLDKRWPINDVRAWGVKDGVLADTEFTNAVTYITRKGGGMRFVHVPGIALVLNEVTFTDLNTVNIHFSGTYILGSATTNKNALITVKNAHTASFTGTVFMENISKKYTYGLYMTAALPSLIAPETGILHNFTIQDLRVIRFPSAVCIGDGSDAQMSEINIGMTSHACNNGVTVNGSQAIVSTTGQIMSGPQPEFTYEPTAFLALGGIIYHNGGEVLCSVDNDSRIATVAPVASTLYGNPCGSVKITGAHIECAGLLMYVRQGSGIVGDVDSKYSCVSFSNCQGSMLNGNGELISVALNGYEGTFSADATCNFYTSATRNKRIVYSTSPSFNFDVSPRAFRKGFGTLAAEIGSGNVNWIHSLQPIIRMAVDVVTIPAGGAAPLGFSARAATGDYLFYYGDTSSGGIVLAHKLDSLVLSISVPATVILLIRVKINGTEVFFCQGSGSVTLTREMLPVGAVITFEAVNSSGNPATTNSTARIVASGSNMN